MGTSLIIFAARYLIVLPILTALALFLRMQSHMRTHALIVGTLSFALAYAAARIAGFIYFDPRPFVVGHFAPLIPHDPDNGFPSDHALLASAIAAVATVYNRRVGIALWIVALAIGTARVLAVLHHPVDIVGSFVIAGAVTWLVSAGIARWADAYMVQDRECKRHCPLA